MVMGMAWHGTHCNKEFLVFGFFFLTSLSVLLHNPNYALLNLFYLWFLPSLRVREESQGVIGWGVVSGIYTLFCSMDVCVKKGDALHGASTLLL